MLLSHQNPSKKNSQNLLSKSNYKTKVLNYLPVKRLIDKIRFLLIPPQAYTPFFQNGLILPIFRIGFNEIEKKSWPKI